jgi:hypothetical protein
VTVSRRHERLLYRFTLRGAAFAIDVAIVTALSGVTARVISPFATSLLIAAQNQERNSLGEVGAALYFAGPAIGALVGLGVIVACYRWLAASPGQIATELSVADATTGNEPTTRQSLARAVVPFGPLLVGLNLPGGLLPGLTFEEPDWAYFAIAGAPLLLLVWYPLLAYSVLVRPSGRGWHDRLTGTVVDWRPDEDEEPDDGEPDARRSEDEATSAS